MKKRIKKTKITRGQKLTHYFFGVSSIPGFQVFKKTKK
jgi:hypothetical protein